MEEIATEFIKTTQLYKNVDLNNITRSYKVKNLFIKFIFLVILPSCTHLKYENELQTQGVHHVGLAVKDLKETSRFFVEALNFKVIKEKPDYPAVFISDGTVMITLWQVEKSMNVVPFDRKKNIGLHHLALKIDRFKDLEEIFKKVKAWPGVKVQFSPELMGDGPGKHTMFYEPGGIRLELTHIPK